VRGPPAVARNIKTRIRKLEIKDCAIVKRLSNKTSNNMLSIFKLLDY